MPNINKSVLNSNLDFIQLKLYDFSDEMIVGVCDDEYVEKIKEKSPVFNQEDRARIIQALEVVDKTELVNIEEVFDKMLAQEIFGFDVLFSGNDWKGTSRYNKTEEKFEKIGVSIEYLPYTQGISTTLIKESLNNP